MRSRASVRHGWARCATSWRRERASRQPCAAVVGGVARSGSGGGERRTRVRRRRALGRCGRRFACLRRGGSRRVVVLALALALAGWWWGSTRLDTLDRSPLASKLDTSERVRLVVTGSVADGPLRRACCRAVVTRFGLLRLHEPVLLKLPLGRAPPQGGIIETIAEVTAPHGPKNGFDERTWLRRHGVHVVLRAGSWQLVGRRGGLGGFADAVRGRLRNSVARGLTGYRAGVVEGVVLGEDAGLSDELRRRFRAAGLYHLLAVSGQNVAVVAGSALVLAWLVGRSAASRRARGARCDRRVRPRRRRPAVGDPRRNRRSARLARVAHGPRRGSLASLARRSDRAARLESVHVVRRGLPVLVRRRGRDLRAGASFLALPRGLPARREAPAGRRRFRRVRSGDRADRLVPVPFGAAV